MRSVRQGLTWLVLGLLGSWVGGWSVAPAQEAVRERGRLSETDEQLESGEYRDIIEFDGERGQVVAIDMTSSEFDTYIFVRCDDDEFKPDNDDFEGEKGHSRLLITLPEDGTYAVYATSHAPGEVGRYNLEILFDEDALADVPEGDQEYTYEGQLSRSDSKLESGEYRDNYTLQARRGQFVTIVLESQDFDPYLFVRSDSDESLDVDNEDDGNSETVARIELEMSVDASMEIAVTSDAPGERGDYTLTIQVTGEPSPGGGASNDDEENEEETPEADDEEMQAGEGIEESGSLSRNDETISSGEYFDVYEYEWEEGETYRVALESEEFDPYVFVRNEDDDELKWDDDGQGDTAEVEVEVPADGVYRVFATSHEPGERGDYTLTIEPVGRSGGRDDEEEPAADEEPEEDERAADAGEGGETREAGSLADGDELLNTGEFYDEYNLVAAVGQSVAVSVESQDFAPYLIVIDENDSEQRWEVPGADGAAEVEFVAPSSSSYRVIVTSEQPADEGDYDLRISVQGAAAGDDEGSAGVRQERGELAAGDETIQSGEFCDIYTLTGTAGQRIVLDLRSDDFDTYVMLRSAEDDEARWDNDDLDGDKHRSQLTVELPADGEYSAYVTSYAVGETGAYSLTITLGAAATAAAGPADHRESGELAEGDAQLPQGQYVDWYEVEGVPGQQLIVELTSDAFDTLITVLCPNGEVLSNDDFAAQSGRSRIDFQVEDFGVHRIGVTSYATGATGPYDLSILAGDVAETPLVEDEPVDDGGGEFFAESGSREGELGPGDERLAQGEYCDRYSFEAERGQRVIIEMQSAEVDSWLWLTGPRDTDEQNDDFLGDRNARIVFDVEESGRYRIAATTRAGDDAGPYTLRVEFADSSDESAGLPRAPEGRRVFGLFVGIADYEGSESDLKYCDKDARRAYEAFQEDFDMTEDEAVLLLDDEATLEAVEAALRDLAARAGPDDMLVFFYSGHGGQEKRDAPDFFDPDGKDETLSLYDEPLRDDRLRELLQDSAVGLTLFVFDSCHSGGFAKDVVVRPGTIGFFSSEEDVLSLLAKERHAGGFLSAFFYEAFHDGRDDVDLNDDDTMTAHELSFFLAERYRQDVRAARPQAAVYEDGPVDPGDNLSYQRLVIDRGGVAPNTPLWSW